MGVDGVREPRLWVDLERKIPWLPKKPYLVEGRDLARTQRILGESGFRIVRAQAPASGVLEEALLVELTEKLQFAASGAGSWAAFNDRLWDLLVAAADEPAVAILIEGSDRLLRADLHAFVRCVHNLLSMTQGVGVSDERADLQVEYFFVGNWKDWA